jgi:hypothetical protein
MKARSQVHIPKDLVDERIGIRVLPLRGRRKISKRVNSSHLRRSPGVLLIGAQKGGTSSLYRYLIEHPDIGAAFTKEVHYFDVQYEQGMNWYLAHFPFRGQAAVTGEASPSYLFHPAAPQRVKETLPQAKLIVLLRNPVDRAYSHHQMNVSKGVEPLSFEEAIAAEPERLRKLEAGTDEEWRVASFVSYLRRGLYTEQLQRWLAVFPPERFLILKSEAFFQRPDEAMQQTLAFLGLPPWRVDRYDVYNPGAYDTMRPETRARLREYFAPHNRQLYDLLGRDFGWEDDDE